MLRQKCGYKRTEKTFNTYKSIALVRDSLFFKSFCLFKSIILSTMCSFYATGFVLNIDPNVSDFHILQKLFLQSLNILITLGASLYSTLSTSFSSTWKKLECLLVSKFTIVPHFVNPRTVVWLTLLWSMMTSWKSSELSVLMLLFYLCVCYFQHDCPFQLHWVSIAMYFPFWFWVRFSWICYITGLTWFRNWLWYIAWCTSIEFYIWSRNIPHLYNISNIMNI